VAPEEDTTLRRAIGAPLLTLYGVGTILGAGIYVVVGKIAARAGTAAPLSFLLAAVVALITGAAFAELSARFPKSAGEAVYVDEGFGRAWLSRGVGLAVALTGVVSAATIARGFSGYLRVFVDVPLWMGAACLVVVLGAIAAWGVRASVGIAVIGTGIEIVGLLLVLFAARGSFSAARFEEVLTPTGGTWTGVFVGAFVAFYAFIGFEDMVNMAEEVKRPERTMPLALGVALAVSTVLYLFVSVACVLALSAAELGASEAPLSDVFAANGGPSWVITAIGLFAISNGAIVQIVMGARVLYGLSKEGWLPAALGRVNERTQTPIGATLLVTALVLGLSVAFPLEQLAQVTSFVILLVFAVVNAALVLVKRKAPEKPGFRVPIWLPVVGAVACLAMVGVRVAVLAGVL
jgi:amino acid transporter